MDFSFFKNLFSGNSSKGEKSAEADAAQEEPLSSGAATPEGAEEELAASSKAKRPRNGRNSRGERRERHPRHERRGSDFTTETDESAAAALTPEEEETILARLREFVLTVATSLVDHPEQVSLELVNEESTHVIMISCAPKDTGKLIGKNGKIISAIRLLVSGSASKSGVRATVDIRD